MKIIAGVIVVVTAAACAPLFSQNVGLAHKVKRGWSAQQVSDLMGSPALTLSIDGVEEWRYCSTRLNAHDEVAVLYFQGGQVVDRAFFSLDRSVRNIGPANPDDDTCLDSIRHVYTDRRQPPRRVLEIRALHSPTR
jgi:hypothetical protein